MTKNRILLFAGAGISAESGLATFRDAGGLWTQYNIAEVCNYAAFKSRDVNIRQKIFSFYTEVREAIGRAQPNAAHFEVARWQSLYGPERVKVVTANVDDLFERAGCTEVLHIHGDSTHMMCAACTNTWAVDSYDITARCPKCNSRLTKPNVVFFGEMAPKYLDMRQTFNDKRRTPEDVVLYVGSSMSVIPPSMIIGDNHSKSQTVLVNLEDGDEGYLFKHKYLTRATLGLPQVFKELIEPNFSA